LFNTVDRLPNGRGKLERVVEVVVSGAGDCSVVDQLLRRLDDRLRAVSGNDRVPLDGDDCRGSIRSAKKLSGLDPVPKQRLDWRPDN
jgi:hypothetical protein